MLFHELVHFVDDVDNVRSFPSHSPLHDESTKLTRRILWQGFELAPISWALAALLGVIFGAAVGLFGLYHVYLACKNRYVVVFFLPP